MCCNSVVINEDCPSKFICKLLIHIENNIKKCIEKFNITNQIEVNHFPSHLSSNNSERKIFCVRVYDHIF